MYHKHNSHVIESNDIESLRASHVDTLPDGTVVARLTVVLHAHKQYAESPALHLTDGVSPRLLHPTPVKASQDEETTEESTDETEAKEKKSKK